MLKFSSQATVKVVKNRWSKHLKDINISKRQEESQAIRAMLSNAELCGSAARLRSRSHSLIIIVSYLK